MLTRRQLRIKVFQALYAYYSAEDRDLAKALKRLQANVGGIYRLYLHDLKALLEIHEQALEVIEKSRRKHLPSQEDIHPNTRFVDNPVFRQLLINKDLTEKFEGQKISWRDYKDTFFKIYQSIRKNDDRFARYMGGSEPAYKDHKSMVKYIYGKYIAQNETIHQLYEDMDIQWADDLEPAQMMVVKTLKALNEDSDAEFKLPSLFNDDEDRGFPGLLFRKVISGDEEFENMISEKTRNWETDRIAMADIIMMKMALAELTGFQEIPVKVTLNEYIDLGKLYSTPKSSQFINGVLDRLVSQLEGENRIQKVGRGLL
ncbi:MAG: transcription antitermination protein NusB [Bacteroidota bacterium]|nr:transcription antitermination protein NusB [Bacteroidota bacterium]MDX5447660.1 transcription antitermination protein NusB [Bacteroidota bacterium]MDX5506589.1 transcription antitermination protein NusB [Bacteroidota bacterium]